MSVSALEGTRHCARYLVGRVGHVCLLSFGVVSLFTVLYHTATPLTARHAGFHDFIETKFGFQQDLPALPQPRISLEDFKDHKPHNFAVGSPFPQETFATFLCTRNGSIHDPYFAATLNLVYRNLWSPVTGSRSRPFTVFVAPFITQEQRDILAGAGATIQELSLVPWEPDAPGVYSRWRDQFSKLHLWNQTQFSRIAFMDSDAFPISNIDGVFDEAATALKACDGSKLTLDDWAEPEKDGLCEYVFAGVSNMDGGVNGGFLVLAPNRAMHTRLLREYVKVDLYDSSVAEQSFFKWHFAANGPFPAQMLPRAYNAFFPGDEDEGRVSVVHEKLWALADDSSPWLADIWENGWREMVEFFDDPVFAQARELDGLVEDVPETSFLVER